jgi:hypothetical protein
MSARTRLEELINITNRKREFAQRYGTTQDRVQHAFGELVAYGIANNYTINTGDVVLGAQDPDSLMHDLFDWTQNEEYRLTQAEMYILYIGILVADNGDLYDLVLEEGE